jgi:histidinol phosphatase-like enzyme
MNKQHAKTDTAEAPLPPKKILFIDRDGTITKELPPTYQLVAF